MIYTVSIYILHLWVITHVYVESTRYSCTCEINGPSSPKQPEVTVIDRRTRERFLVTSGDCSFF